MSAVLQHCYSIIIFGYRKVCTCCILSTLCAKCIIQRSSYETSLVHQMYFNQIFWLPKSQCISRKQNITVNVLFIAFCLYHIVLFRLTGKERVIGIGIIYGIAA